MKTRGFFLAGAAMFLTLLTDVATADENIELERIVITPSRVEESSEKTGSSVSVISSKTFGKKNIYAVNEALEGITGVDLAHTGGLGGTTSVFLRGASAGQTRVMIDGVKVYDPTSVDASYDFAHLATDSIERIEILKGPQSSLYGSDAIGGVINIITKKGFGKPKIYLSTEGGSYYTSRESFELNGEKEKLHFSLTASRLDSEGYSKAKEKNNNPEDDSYQNTNASLRLDYDVAENLTLGLISRYLYARSESDDYDFTNDRPIDDPDRINWNDEGLVSFFADNKLSDYFRHKMRVSYTRNYRRGKDDTDEFERDWYNGKTYQLDWQAETKICDFDMIVSGVNYLREIADTYYFHGVFGETDTPKETSSVKGAFIENKLKILDVLFFNAAYRMDYHSNFKYHDTYKFDFSCPIQKTGTRLKGLYGTGYKSPSLYQLTAPPMFGLPVGNANLRPEESESYEVGVEQELLKESLAADVTLFHTNFKQLIDFVFGTGYVNLSRARVKGVESSIRFKKNNATCKLGYTWLNTENKENGDELLKRARHKASLEFNWVFAKLGLNFSLRYVGHRTDYKNKLLKPYTVADLALNYRLNKNSTLFSRIENLFNEKYEETKNYQTGLFAVYGGLKFNF
jgi:vitamin B12 transporter